MTPWWRSFSAEIGRMSRGVPEMSRVLLIRPRRVDMRMLVVLFPSIPTYSRTPESDFPESTFSDCSLDQSHMCYDLRTSAVGHQKSKKAFRQNNQFEGVEG